jgi:hypothetical protein
VPAHSKARPCLQALNFSWLQVFFDVEDEGGRVLEICIKEGPTFTVEQVKALRDDIKLGDILLVVGTADAFDPDVVLPHRVTVTARWKDRHPGQHFVPKCSAVKLTQREPLGAAEKSQRNDQQPQSPSNVTVSLMSPGLLDCVLLARYLGMIGQHPIIWESPNDDGRFAGPASIAEL